MAFRHWLLAAIVLTIVVSIAPSQAATLEVHELREYWVEEPLAELAPTGLATSRADAPAAASIDRQRRLAVATLVRLEAERRILPRAVELAETRDGMFADGHRPRPIVSARPPDGATDPF